MATTTSPIQVPKDGTADGELLRVENLKMYFPITQGIIMQRQVGWVRAVDDISFTVKRGETLGLVGESGCGKSTTGRAILQLYKPTGGKVLFSAEPDHPGRRAAQDRRQMQMIFRTVREPEPRMTVSIVGEPLEITSGARPRKAGTRQGCCIVG
jgi:oligopeptide transport system ATP-binding protein